MFNVVLKLNNHFWKKLQNYFFVEKNEAQTNQWIRSRKKISKSLIKIKKKKSSSLAVQIWSSKQCAEIFFK